MLPEPEWISSDALRLLHAQQLERFGGLAGVLDENVVESTLARPRNLCAYRDDVDLADLAAAYLCGIARKQGFVDGNKRTGLAAALVFLHINGSPLHVPPPELFRVVMDVATNRVSDDPVAEFIRHRL